MAEYSVAPVEEMPPGSRRIIKVGRMEVGVFNVHGQFYALPNVCTHQFGPLCQGELGGTIIAPRETGFRVTWVQEGEVISCPWHGLEFNVTTGQCLAYPRVRLRRYTVEIHDGIVKVIA